MPPALLQGSPPSGGKDREAQPVLRALRKAGIHVVALHNHMIGEEPAFYFLHLWGKGPAQEPARGVRSALYAQKEAAMRSKEP